jgi:hypothetical protein
MEEGAFAGRRRVGRRPPVTRTGWAIAAISLLVVGCIGNSRTAHSPSTPRPTVMTSVGQLSNGLRERTVSYDPPKRIEPSELLTSESYFSSFPGAPSLVLRSACMRSSTPPQVEPSYEQPPSSSVRHPRISVVRGCTAPEITEGKWTGLLVSPDGEVFTPMSP